MYQQFAATRRSALLALIAVVLLGSTAWSLERRDEVTFLRGPYNTEFFSRHNGTFRYSGAFHYYHAKQHDILQLTELARAPDVDRDFDADVLDFTLKQKARTEPTMELFGPYVARMAWKVYRAIDWTHMHHEQTYDVMSDRTIPWSEKSRWTDRSVRYYLERDPVARSAAPLDVTMRRAAVMMKPYFTYYRNYYPRSNNFAYVAHWWHPVVYEAMMLGGNGLGQNALVRQVDETMVREVLADRPLRMLLSREIMPRYARMSPESANIFDNLHMLHGVVYDILAYEGWTPEQKRAELYRVVDAMSHRPGDETLARKFSTPYPDLDPRVYYDWMRTTDGEMNRIMTEMLEEMMPHMMPGGMAPEIRARVMAQFRMKLMPGQQAGEVPGSLHDALMKVMPGMKAMPGTSEPGQAPTMMVDVMLRGWREKHGGMPDIEPWPMGREPSGAPPQARR